MRKAAKLNPSFGMESMAAQGDSERPGEPALQAPGAEGEDHIVINGVRLDLKNILNPDLLGLKKVEAFAETFRTADPFPHIVFEGLFSPKLLELMYADFDKLNWSQWRRYDNLNERKLGSLPNTRFGNAAQLYFNTVYSGPFINFLGQVTGIIGLIPDPGLHAGGLHEIPPGGKFALHTDFNQHPVTRLDNRLVFITYLNKDWLASYGGGLELWSMDEDQCKKVVEPNLGRSILFYQSSKSLHGHPQPVDAPNGRPRRSAAAYFYSNGRSDNETTEFHTTIFPRPIRLTKREKLVNAVKYVTPPILIDTGRRLKRSLRSGR